MMFLKIRFPSASVIFTLLNSPNIILSTLFPYTHNLHYSIYLKISGSYPYKTEGKIIIPYILIFTT